MVARHNSSPDAARSSTTAAPDYHHATRPERLAPVSAIIAQRTSIMLDADFLSDATRLLKALGQQKQPGGARQYTMR